jgi:hypothetical protein
MECQDVRQLLAFLERKSEELDAAEGAALQKHLDACPDCAALAASERSADQAIGVALRDVAVPAGLKQQVLSRLAVERGVAPWKRWAGVAAAAMLLAAIGGAWVFWPKPELTNEDVKSYAGANWSKESVEHYFEGQGLKVRAPDKFMYQYLHQVDVVLINGRRVAKLTFVRSDDRAAFATVLIIDKTQFKVDDIDPKKELDTLIKVRFGEDESSQFIYVIHLRFRGDLESLELGPPGA